MRFAIHRGLEERVSEATEGVNDCQLLKGLLMLYFEVPATIGRTGREGLCLE